MSGEAIELLAGPRAERESGNQASLIWMRDLVLKPALDSFVGDPADGAFQEAS